LSELSKMSQNLHHQISNSARRQSPNRGWCASRGGAATRPPRNTELPPQAITLSLLQGSCSCRFGHAGRSPCLRLLLTTHVLQDRLFSQLPHLNRPLTQHVRIEHARFEKPCPNLSGAFCRNLSVYDISIVLAHKYLEGISVIPSPAIPTRQTHPLTAVTYKHNGLSPLSD
jgi:hypothetical protein